MDENEMNDSGKSRGKVVFLQFSLPDFIIQTLLSLINFRKGLQALGLNVHELKYCYPVSPACMDILEIFLIL